MGVQITSMSAKDEEQVAAVDVEDSDTDDDMPEMEDGEDGESKGRAKQSRSEKKSRKAMQKLGMKPVPGIGRVTVKKSKNIFFVIKDPDVFKMNDSNPKGPQTFIVFGKAEIEDLSQQATNAAVEQFKPPPGDSKPAAEAVDELDGDDDGDEDAGDLDENDIELVVKQAGVSRAKAIEALKLNDKDVVKEIMALSSEAAPPNQSAPD